ncbi:MAG: tetratricopeptide repeat protein, partial [Bacteroidota bacterium]
MAYVSAQDTRSRLKRAEIFTVRGTVLHKYSNEPIESVNIEVNGGAYTVTANDGSFRIKVRVGDELVVRHKDFETVYHTILNDDRIKIEVEPQEPQPTRKERLRRSIQAYNQLIDSADTYRKRDAEKSIQFIADALDKSSSQEQNAEAYELLGDIYMYWKQYDLAVTNYRISLQNVTTNSAQLKLGHAYRSNKNYQESIQTYLNISGSKLSNWQRVELQEGLGDTYTEIKDFNKAISSYETGLGIAQKHLISPKITDLNSKIAQVYNLKGDLSTAKNFFSNSLNLAEQENMTRALEEKNRVADFENTNQSYKDEIQLRKSIVKDTDDIERDSVITNESPLTPQKQNYKIGNAYYLQKDYDSAIPYLQKSIKEAETRSDLVVKKDGLKKLTDVYEDSGDPDNALKAYKEYTDVVDELYRQKEQELAQAARFSRNIAENQNRITSLESDRALTKSRYDLSLEQTKRQQLIIYSLIGGLVLLSIAAYF